MRASLVAIAECFVLAACFLAAALVALAATFTPFELG
jgi:hypothetical protein